MDQLRKQHMMEEEDFTTHYLQGKKYQGPYQQENSLVTAEAEALKAAAKRIIMEDLTPNTRIVFLTDALSVVTALKNKKNTDLQYLTQVMAEITCKVAQVTVQWIPSHCDIDGNEKADHLAKKGVEMDQNDLSDMKRQRGTFAKKWSSIHPQHYPKDRLSSLD